MNRTNQVVNDILRLVAGALTTRVRTFIDHTYALLDYLTREAGASEHQSLGWSIYVSVVDGSSKSHGAIDDTVCKHEAKQDYSSIAFHPAGNRLIFGLPAISVTNHPTPFLFGGAHFKRFRSVSRSRLNLRLLMRRAIRFAGLRKPSVGPINVYLSGANGVRIATMVSLQWSGW